MHLFGEVAGGLEPQKPYAKSATVLLNDYEAANASVGVLSDAELTLRQHVKRLATCK